MTVSRFLLTALCATLGLVATAKEQQLKSGFDLAASMHAIKASNPGAHRVLEDGTFDTMVSAERIEFVARLTTGSVSDAALGVIASVERNRRIMASSPQHLRRYDEARKVHDLQMIEDHNRLLGILSKGTEGMPDLMRELTQARRAITELGRENVDSRLSELFESRAGDTDSAVESLSSPYTDQVPGPSAPLFEDSAVKSSSGSPDGDGVVALFGSGFCIAEYTYCTTKARLVASIQTQALERAFEERRQEIWSDYDCSEVNDDVVAACDAARDHLLDRLHGNYIALLSWIRETLFDSRLRCVAEYILCKIGV